jgi:biofilm protein TabA
MIATSLEQIDQQVEMTLSLTKAIEFLRLRDILDLKDGRTDIDGDRVFALVQRYETAKMDTPKFEHHKKYIDVQYIASGEEVIGWAPVERMKINEAYDADRDICFGTMPAGQWTPILLQAGQLAVFYPEDGHAPKLAAHDPSSVMKIVIKIAL